MPNFPDELLDAPIRADERIDPNEVDEIKTIISKLYEMMNAHPNLFNYREENFIDNLFTHDEGEQLTDAQINWLYALDRKYLR